jgi:hypothetical protein
MANIISPENSSLYTMSNNALFAYIDQQRAGVKRLWTYITGFNPKTRSRNQTSAINGAMGEIERLNDDIATCYYIIMCRVKIN